MKIRFHLFNLTEHFLIQQILLHTKSNIMTDVVSLEYFSFFDRNENSVINYGCFVWAKNIIYHFILQNLQHAFTQQSLLMRKHNTRVVVLLWKLVGDNDFVNYVAVFSCARHSCCFIKLRLNHWSHMHYIYDALTLPIWALKVVVVLAVNEGTESELTIKRGHIMTFSYKLILIL